jgi:hypothetical protein
MTREELARWIHGKACAGVTLRGVEEIIAVVLKWHEEKIKGRLYREGVIHRLMVSMPSMRLETAAGIVDRVLSIIWTDEK